MTKEEALRELSMHLMQCGALMPIDWVTTHGEGSRTMEAFEMAMEALKKSDEAVKIDACFDLQYAPPGMTDEEKIEMAREATAHDLACLLIRRGEFWIDRENNCVRGVMRLQREEKQPVEDARPHKKAAEGGGRHGETGGANGGAG